MVAENIVRDENGAPVKGQWEAIVDEPTWRVVHDGLRVRARGKQDAYRKFFGSGVYRCGVCGGPLYAASGSYRCLTPEHVCRLQQPIDTLVVATIRAYLSLPNYRDLLPKRSDEDVLEELKQRIARAESELGRIREDWFLQQALKDEDPVKATSVLSQDDQLDRINKASAGILAGYAAAHTDAIPFCLGFGGVFRKLERTGDHLTNIAEEIVFYIDAKVLKHNDSQQEDPARQA